MQQLPIKIRNFNPDTDFTAYTELLNTAAKFDDGQQTTEEAQKQTAEMLTINLGHDRFIVENPQDNSQIIAVCDCWQIAGNPSADLFLLVHPDWRRKGIGSVLFQRASSHARSLEATAIDAYATPAQSIIQAFLKKYRFKITGNFTEMQLTQQTAFAKALLPDGYSVRTYNDLEGTQTDKVNLILKAGREFWGVLWGHKVRPDNDVSRQLIQEHIVNEFPEESMFFLFDENNIYIGHDRVNFSEATNDATGEITKTGHVGVPAIHPQYHSPELSTQFALIGLNHLFEQGCREFNLTSWGESDVTIQAFEDLGFKTSFFEIGYQLKLN